MVKSEKKEKNNQITRLSTEFSTLFDDDSDEDFSFLPVVSSYSVLPIDSDCFVSYIIIKENQEVMIRCLLDGLLYLTFGEKRCLKCGMLNLLKDDRYCKYCDDDEDIAYLKCLFHSPLKVYGSKCFADHPLCSYTDNIYRCFDRYYLYIGRIGEQIKTGISRYRSSSLKFKRLIEQGLNEAWIIYPFESLSDVTSFERLLIDEYGLEERITFAEKVENLIYPSTISLESFFTENQYKELFPDKKIIKKEYYREGFFNNYLSSSFEIVLKQETDEIQGNVVFSQGNIGVVKQKYQLTFFDISKLIGKTVKTEGDLW